jgi:hypothetical protein
MKPIAIFYHVYICGDYEKAIIIINEQINLLESSGLLGAADEFYVNSHGGQEEFLTVLSLAGPKAIVTCSQDTSGGLEGELPTFAMLQDWLPGHRGWNVFYFHAKGITKPDDQFRFVWRRCMMRATVQRWRECVNALDSGMDMAGPHWLTPEKYPGTAHLVRPIWGGNFFWATANYLLSLPPLIRKTAPGLDRYMAENWVGMGKHPKVMDFAPHWPEIGKCSKS